MRDIHSVPNLRVVKWLKSQPCCFPSLNQYIIFLERHLHSKLFFPFNSPINLIMAALKHWLTYKKRENVSEIFIHSWHGFDQ